MISSCYCHLLFILIRITVFFEGGVGFGLPVVWQGPHNKPYFRELNCILKFLHTDSFQAALREGGAQQHAHVASTASSTREGLLASTTTWQRGRGGQTGKLRGAKAVLFSAEAFRKVTRCGNRRGREGRRKARNAGKAGKAQVPEDRCGACARARASSEHGAGFQQTTKRSKARDPDPSPPRICSVVFVRVCGSVLVGRRGSFLGPWLLPPVRSAGRTPFLRALGLLGFFALPHPEVPESEALFEPSMPPRRLCRSP